MQPTEEQGLSFKKICVDVTEKRILWSVSGEAKPGRILALMGPSGKQRNHNRSYIGATPLSSFDLCFYLPIFSYFCLGSGKTTLLNSLAGYTQIASGSITLHGHRMNKRVRRQVSYVLQADIFFPNLTLRETLRVSDLEQLLTSVNVVNKLSVINKFCSTQHY